MGEGLVLKPQEIKEYAKVMKDEGIVELKVGEVTIAIPQQVKNFDKMVSELEQRLTKENKISNEDILMNPYAGLEDNNG